MSKQIENRIFSKLRVARGCFIGVEECLADAAGFAQRGKAALEEVKEMVDAALPKSAAPPRGSQKRLRTRGRTKIAGRRL